MGNHDFFRAPEGKFRVIEIDEYEQQFSIVEEDYIETVKDCGTIAEAELLVQEVTKPSHKRLIYDSNGNCVGQSKRTGKLLR
ncbi:MAG: hypothetical protein ABR875_02860 [Minisyncoccia bacterium]